MPWKIRETEPIGERTFYEVYKVLPSGDTIFRGNYERESEAQRLADNLNKAEVERLERIR